MFPLEGFILAATLVMVVWWSEVFKKFDYILTLFWPHFLGLCMQECESSSVTKIEADIPTRRGDFGDHTYDGGMVV